MKPAVAPRVMRMAAPAAPEAAQSKHAYNIRYPIIRYVHQECADAIRVPSWELLRRGCAAHDVKARRGEFKSRGKGISPLPQLLGNTSYMQKRRSSHCSYWHTIREVLLLPTVHATLSQSQPQPASSRALDDLLCKSRFLCSIHKQR